MNRRLIKGFRLLVLTTILLIFTFVRTYRYLEENEISGEINTVGYISAPVQPRDTYKSVNVRLFSGQDLTVYVGKNEPINYGDHVRLKGNVEKNWMFFPSIKREEGRTIKPFNDVVYNLRAQITSRISSVFHQPYSDIVVGVVFGIKTDIGGYLSDSLRQAGIIHIIVASGYNVTVVIALVGALTSLLTKRLRLIACALSIAVYILIAGFEPPIIRAAIMAIATLLASSTGRQRDAFLWLFYSAIIMLLAKPLLFESLSFMLSFGATLGILLLSERVEKILLLLPNPLRQDLATTLSAQVGVAPIIYLAFKSYSFVGLVVNPLVLWTIPIIMMFSLVVFALTFFSNWLAVVVSLPVVLLIKWMLFVVSIFTV